MQYNSITILETIKKIYPEIKGGFSYHSSKPDCTDWDDPIEGLVWENTQFEKPTWSQIEELIESVELSIEKENKISQLDSLVSSKIFSQYSQIKQINIGNRINGYTDEDFNRMNAFISLILSKRTQIKTAINNCESIEEIEEIKLNLEGEE